TNLQLAAADDLIAFHFRIPVEDLVWAFRVGFFVVPAVAFWITQHVCLSLQRADRRRLRLGVRYGIAALPASDGEHPGYAAVSRPVTPDERAVLEAVRPDELITAIPRHLIPLPTPRRAAAQLRAR